MLPTVNRSASTKPFTPDFRSIDLYEPFESVIFDGRLSRRSRVRLRLLTRVHCSFGFKYLKLRQLCAVNGIHVGIVQGRRETNSLQRP